MNDTFMTDKSLRFKVFIIVHYFNGLQQKEVTIYKKSNIKTALNYINVKSKMCAVTKGA